jgi:L-iditol 2-dehydrogenase
MKALRRISGEPFDMRLVDVEEPKLKNDDWIKVKVEYAGICGSDISMLETAMYGSPARLKVPVTPGHEGSGVVVEAGKNVTRFKPGDRVVYMTITDNCGTCRYCYSGDWGKCKQRKGLGSSIDGSFAEYVVMPHRNAILLPDSVDIRVAALTEPIGCAVRITEEIGKVKRGENVIIHGPGVIGASCGIVALANGANVIMIGTPHAAFRLRKCEEIGMETVTNDGDLDRKIHEIWSDRDIDVALDAVGTEETFAFNARIVRHLGRIVQGASKFPGIYNVDMRQLFLKQIQIGNACSTRPESWISAIDIIEKYPERVSKMLGDVYPLTEWEAAYDAAKKRESFKIMMKP